MGCSVHSEPLRNLRHNGNAKFLISRPTQRMLDLAHSAGCRLRRPLSSRATHNFWRAAAFNGSAVKQRPLGIELWRPCRVSAVHRRSAAKANIVVVLLANQTQPADAGPMCHEICPIKSHVFAVRRVYSSSRGRLANI